MIVHAADVVQLTVGAVLGVVVSVNMGQQGLSVMNPKTRWKAIGVISLFLFSFLLLSDLINTLFPGPGGNGP